MFIFIFFSMSSSDSSDVDNDKSPAPSLAWLEACSETSLPNKDVDLLDSLTETTPIGNSPVAAVPSPDPKPAPVTVPQQQNKPDTAKPTASYVELIARALLTATNYRMILADIYGFILSNYPYYETARSTWRNAVRHNLCVNDCFIKAGRSNSGRGFYWAIHPACVDMFKKGDFRRHQARKLAQQIVPVSRPTTRPPTSWSGTTVNHMDLSMSMNRTPYMTPTAMTANTTAPPNVYIAQSMYSTAGAYRTQAPMSYTPNYAHHMQMNPHYQTNHASQIQTHPTNYYNQYYAQVVPSGMVPTQHTMYQ